MLFLLFTKPTSFLSSAFLLSFLESSSSFNITSLLIITGVSFLLSFFVSFFVSFLFSTLFSFFTLFLLFFEYAFLISVACSSVTLLKWLVTSMPSDFAFSSTSLLDIPISFASSWIFILPNNSTPYIYSCA